jgi:hypothetical protein
MRVSYSINERVVSDFNRIVPARKRSEAIQNMMAKIVAEQEAAIARAAEGIEADESYREAEGFAQAHGAETVSRNDGHE